MSTWITHEPVLNKHKAITATRLTVHAATSGAALQGLRELADVWPTAHTLFVGFDGFHPDTQLLEWQQPDNAMLEISAASLGQEATRDLVRELMGQRAPLCLANYQGDVELPPNAGFRFVLADAGVGKTAMTLPGIAIAQGLSDGAGFDAALKNGFGGAAGWFFMHNVGGKARKLQPAHAHIVRVLNLVRRSAEVKDIEAALKQDVALSFKLLRYVNSVGFGLMCEVQSFRHAVAILGYEKLNKWLSLLLVTASKDPAAQAMMQASIARGRMMELLGEDYFDKGELDNLFIVGAFSLLDTLLGVNMETVLEEMTLPEPIHVALMGGDSPYLPLLDLARACETGDAKLVDYKAQMVAIDPTRFNRAQLQALQFADTLQA
jgi:EAL and modified HD-GYP domain-containing signal transduction protein